MPQPKPVKYPNLLSQISDAVSAHQAVHDEVATHAQEHHEKLDQKRKQAHVAAIAKKLIEGDGKS